MVPGMFHVEHSRDHGAGPSFFIKGRPYTKNPGRTWGQACRGVYRENGEKGMAN